MELYSFAKGFKRARKKSGYTQESFVKNFLDEQQHELTSLKTVQNWEQSLAIPEFRTIEKLCEFFNCDIDYLFYRIDQKTHDIQYIHEYTGLSEKAIEQLHWLYHSGSPNLRDNIVSLNYLIESLKFSVSLLQDVTKFIFKYQDYEQGQKLYKDEQKRRPQISNDDILGAMKIMDEYEPLINSKKLSELAEKKEVALWHMTTRFSDIVTQIAQSYFQNLKEKKTRNPFKD